MFVIIIPYRDRALHKDILLNKLPEYIKNYHNLSDNGYDYKIIISEQKDNRIFNLSLARNFAALWAESNFKDITHFIFHDVDVVPIKNIDYKTPETIIYFTNYGSIKIKNEDFFKVNGYNPVFMGWGEEDLEFMERLETHKIKLKKSIYTQSNYTSPVECIVEKDDNTSFLDLECKYHVSDRSFQNHHNWRDQKERDKNIKLLTFVGSVLTIEERKIFFTKFGLNLVNTKFTNKTILENPLLSPKKEIDLNNFIIHLEYDSALLDSKVFKLRNKL